MASNPTSLTIRLQIKCNWPLTLHRSKNNFLKCKGLTIKTAHIGTPKIGTQRCGCNKTVFGKAHLWQATKFTNCKHFCFRICVWNNSRIRIIKIHGVPWTSPSLTRDPFRLSIRSPDRPFIPVRDPDPSEMPQDQLRNAEIIAKLSPRAQTGATNVAVAAATTTFRRATN